MLFRILVVFLISTSSFYSSYSQTTVTPTLVLKAFETKYPNASNVIWTESSGEYKVAFHHDGFSYESKFSNNGNWKISQREITLDQLPPVIRKGVLKSEFGDWSIRSTYVLFLPGMITQYRIIVTKSDADKKSLLFSQDGKLLKDSFTL
jgi:hypothetical protein